MVELSALCLAFWVSYLHDRNQTVESGHVQNYTPPAPNRLVVPGTNLCAVTYFQGDFQVLHVKVPLLRATQLSSRQLKENSLGSRCGSYPPCLPYTYGRPRECGA